MNNPEDHTWLNLAAIGAPAYSAAGPQPPYGFTTRVLARLRAEQREQKLAERIGLRAIFAAFAILLVTGVFAVDRHASDRSDLEPGLRGFVQAADLPLS